MPFSLVTLGSQQTTPGTPEVTFWRTQHRRPTEFLLLCVEQDFTTKVSFGECSTCPVSPCGDLVRDVVLRLEVPPVFSMDDPSRCFRWKPAPGYRMVKAVQVEVDGEVLQTLTGDWLVQQMQLSANLEGLRKMVGGVTEFSPFLQPKTLFVPLPLFFCSEGRHFPVRVTNNLKVRLSLEPLYNVLEQGPSYSCKIEGAAPWVEGEKLSTQGGSRLVFFGVEGDTVSFNLLEGALPVPGDRLRASPEDSAVVVTSPAQPLSSPSLPRVEVTKASLLVNYVLLGDKESELVLSKEDFHYLVPEVHSFQSSFSLDATLELRFSVPAPCTEVVWCVEDRLGNKVVDHLAFTLKLDGNNFLEDMPADFFRYIQPFQHHNHSRRLEPGYFFYSFALAPEQTQPSGCSAPFRQMQLLARVEKKKVDLVLRALVTTVNVATVRSGKARLLL